MRYWKLIVLTDDLTIIQVYICQQIYQTKITHVCSITNNSNLISVVQQYLK